MHNYSKHSYIIKFTTVSTVVLTTITAISGLLFSASHAFASDTSSTIDFSLEVMAACSLSATSGSNLSTTINAGDTSLIGTTSLKAVCNDNGGLAIYAIGYTGSDYGDTNLRRQEAGSLSTTSLIPTGVSLSTSYWNMTVAENTSVQSSYSPVIPLEFQSAHVIPSTQAQIASYSSTTDQTAGVNINVSYNTHAALDQPAGIYKGKVKYTLVHPALHAAPIIPTATAHQICYNGNDEDAGAMACQTTVDTEGSTTAISANADVQLRASNFSRAGYGFTGWNTKEDGSGTQYGPNETINFTQSMYDNGLMLFAQWQAAETGVTMQTFNDNTYPYSSMPNGTVIALRDVRDDDVYAVAKLPYQGNYDNYDGKWWMIENLRLDYDANITTSNTQSNYGSWGGVFAGLAEPESANFSNSTTANSLYTPATSSCPRCIVGTNTTIALRFPRYNNDNTASRVSNQISTDANIYSYGNYYTWAAAVASTAGYSTGDQSVTGTSLCPTGWHLPESGNKNNEANNEWWGLTRAIVGFDPANYSSSSAPDYRNDNNTEGTDAARAMCTYPVNLIYSGRFYDSSAINRGTVGVYWSTTVANNVSSYVEYMGLSVNGDTVFVDPGSGHGKYNGHTIRCIAN